jgi:CMP-N,N'-diacetyllegionaminic acid synthase
MYWRGEDGRMSPVVATERRPTRRQDMGPAFAPNGAVYVVDVQTFLARPDFMPPGTVGLVMPSDRSIDINDAADIDLAEALAHKYE